MRIAKKWYAQTIRGVKGDWEVLQNKLCLAFFPEIYKAPTLGSEGKDLIDKHGSFTLDFTWLPQIPYLQHASPESAVLSALSIHGD
jgi:hypothetical protein